jgi:hypothetical protein
MGSSCKWIGVAVLTCICSMFRMLLIYSFCIGLPCFCLMFRLLPYVKTMSCSGSHLGITINIQNTKFVKDLLKIDAQFRFNQCNSFREENISVFSHTFMEHLSSCSVSSVIGTAYLYGVPKFILSF